jgi:hypothetical protein
MTEMPRVRLRDVILFLGILAVAAGVSRLPPFLCRERHRPWPPRRTGRPLSRADRACRQPERVPLVRRVRPSAATEQTAHVSPGYPWLLGWLAPASISIRRCWASVVSGRDRVALRSIRRRVPQPPLPPCSSGCSVRCTRSGWSTSPRSTMACSFLLAALFLGADGTGGRRILQPALRSDAGRSCPVRRLCRSRL